MRFPFGLFEPVYFGNAPNASRIHTPMPHISLVVDDEPAVRRYITSILQREHFQTVEAEDGVRGLQIVQEFGDAVDVIVSDVQMPNCDGVSFAHAVKEMFPALPIILVSACGEPNGEFDGFLQKPFGPGALLQAVRKAVARTAKHLSD